MLNRIGMAVGAGLASALLFVVTIKGTALALALAYLAPLPLMIATLGWGVGAGLVALAVACAVVATAIEPMSGMLFGLTLALPAWGLATLASLRGPHAISTLFGGLPRLLPRPARARVRRADRASARSSAPPRGSASRSAPARSSR